MTCDLCLSQRVELLASTYCQQEGANEKITLILRERVVSLLSLKRCFPFQLIRSTYFYSFQSCYSPLRSVKQMIMFALGRKVPLTSYLEESLQLRSLECSEAEY